MSERAEVSPELRVQLKSIDAALLGRRLRLARQRAGLTQGEAAGTDMSTAYISRIEAGQRRPGPELLVSLAARLQCAPEDLLAPDDSVETVDPDLLARASLELDYAELELRTGSADAALARTTALLQSTADTALPSQVLREAHLVRALALESTGALQESIIALEDVVADETRDAAAIDSSRLVRTLIALSRAYRDSGDLARAVDVGDRAAGLVDEADLAGSAEGLQLTVTVAAAHYERGDVNHAVRLCQRALASAEDLDSPAARAAAYWNSSIMESRAGRVSSALVLAQRAIGLLDQTDDARNQARLRTVLGLLLLRVDPPSIADAVELFDRAEVELGVSSTSVVDVARNRVGQARAAFLGGDDDRAADLAAQVVEVTSGGWPLLCVEALVLLGQVAFRQGSSAAAVARFRDAITVLSAVGSDREAAQLWFELGGLLQECGEVQDALDAYRRAAASTGLSAPTPSRATYGVPG